MDFYKKIGVALLIIPFLVGTFLVSNPRTTYADTTPPPVAEKEGILKLLEKVLELLKEKKASQQASADTSTASTTTSGQTTCRSTVSTNNPDVLRLSPTNIKLNIFPDAKIETKIYKNETVIHVEVDEKHDIFTTSASKKSDIIDAIFDRYNFPKRSIVDKLIQTTFGFNISTVLNIKNENRDSVPFDKIPKGKAVCS